MLKRCQKILLNGKRCTKKLLPDEIKFCKKHRTSSRVTTYSIGQRQFSGYKTSTPYETYIQSEQWRRRSIQEKNSNNNKCSLCHRSGILHTHHSTYVRLGNEQHGDLTVLCENCHVLFHNFYEYDSLVGYFKPKDR